MNKKNTNRPYRSGYPLLSLGLILFLLSGCIAPETLVNFNQGPNFLLQADSILNQTVFRIQADDLLAISVSSPDPATAAPFNPQTSLNQNNSNASKNGGDYLVNPDGTIDFPILGNLLVSGKTTQELHQDLQERLTPYLKNPIVSVRVLNFRVTVLGEVNQPGAFQAPDQSLTILEALGMAGDLSPYARRDSVLLIREQNGRRTFGRLNLQDRSVFQSPFFYLKQNDVIYVQPIDEKTASVRDQPSKILPWITALSTFATLIATLILRK